MRFDTVIIGGGLAGLTAGLRLQQRGRHTAIVSAGQNALHFSSGSFELLARTPAGTPVAAPLNAIPTLPEDHPYRKVGPDAIGRLLRELPGFFGACGIPLHGDPLRNSWRLTPTGTLLPTALATEDITLLPAPDARLADRVLLVNLRGYIDFYPAFIADALAARGTACRTGELDLTELEALRTHPIGMRSVNIAHVIDRPDVLQAVIDGLKALLRDEDAVLLPQVFGFRDSTPLATLRQALPVPVHFLGTMPPSVPGMRIQMRLKQAYEAAGGTFLMGDTVCAAETADQRVLALRTARLDGHRLLADTFLLATGSYFSKGLDARPDGVAEPLFGLDVLQAPTRPGWYRPGFFEPQPYMDFGVATDGAFRALRGGRPFTNLYAIGSILGHADPLRLGCGGGVAILTALHTADRL